MIENQNLDDFIGFLEGVSINLKHTHEIAQEILNFEVLLHDKAKEHVENLKNIVN